MVSLEQGGAVTVKIIDLGLAKAVEESQSRNGDFDRWEFRWDTRVR